uniref:Bromo domain-containing protein n=1 Tax=Palpitomonas bilix TaxID=652834 RepID=A0A7S3DD89_9EUKA
MNGGQPKSRTSSISWQGNLWETNATVVDELLPPEVAKEKAEKRQKDLNARLEGVMRALKDFKAHSFPFLKPVSRKEVPDYYDVIKRPIDLLTMSKRLKNDNYKCVQDFANDLDLMWSNCRLYNSDINNVYREHARQMENRAAELLAQVEDPTLDQSDDDFDQMEIEKQGSDLTREERQQLLAEQKAVSDCLLDMKTDEEVAELRAFRLVTKEARAKYNKFRKVESAKPFSERQAIVRTEARMNRTRDARVNLESAQFQREADVYDPFERHSLGLKAWDLPEFTSVASGVPPDPYSENGDRRRRIEAGVRVEEGVDKRPGTVKLHGFTDKMTYDTARTILSRVVVTSLSHQGVSSVEKSALEAMVDLLCSRIMPKVATHMQQAAEAAQRVLVDRHTIFEEEDAEVLSRAKEAVREHTAACFKERQTVLETAKASREDQVMELPVTAAYVAQLAPLLADFVFSQNESRSSSPISRFSDSRDESVFRQTVETFSKLDRATRLQQRKTS